MHEARLSFYLLNLQWRPRLYDIEFSTSPETVFSYSRLRFFYLDGRIWELFVHSLASLMRLSGAFDARRREEGITWGTTDIYLDGMTMSTKYLK